MHEYSPPFDENGFAPRRRLSGCKYASFEHDGKVSDNKPFVLYEMKTKPAPVCGTGFMASRKRLSHSAGRCFRREGRCFPEV